MSTPTNVARGRAVTSSSPPRYGGSPSLVTDGVTDTNPYLSLEAGAQWVRIDLGGLYDVSRLRVFHYWADGRTYHDVIFRLSQDGTSYITIFNNDQDNSSGYGMGTDTE